LQQRHLRPPLPELAGNESIGGVRESLERPLPGGERVVADEGFFRFSAELSGEIRRIFPGKIRSAAEVCSHPVRNKPQRPAGFGLEQIHFWCRAALKGHGFSRAAKYGKISGL